MKKSDTQTINVQQLCDCVSKGETLTEKTTFWQDGKNTVKFCLRNIAALVPVQHTVLTIIIIIIIIIRQPLCPVVGQRPQHAVVSCIR